MITTNPSAQFANENMLTWEGATFTLSPSQNTHVAVLDGSAIHAKHDFLRNLAESLGFPEYFGHNWDALHDCLTDLAWIPAEHVLLIYSFPK